MTHDELVELGAQLEHELEASKIAHMVEGTPESRARVTRAQDALVEARMYWRQIGTVTGTRTGIVIENNKEG